MFRREGDPCRYHVGYIGEYAGDLVKIRDEISRIQFEQNQSAINWTIKKGTAFYALRQNV